jgi:hypothetical protein
MSMVKGLIRLQCPTAIAYRPIMAIAYLAIYLHLYSQPHTTRQLQTATIRSLTARMVLLHIGLLQQNIMVKGWWFSVVTNL